MDLLKSSIQKYKDNLIDFDIIYLYFSKRIDYLCKSFNLIYYKNDLTLFLWLLIKKIDIHNFLSDSELDNYIFISLKNYCKNLYKKTTLTQNKESYFTPKYYEKDTESYDLENVSSICFTDLISFLPKKQKLIINLRYKYCLSDIEIANTLNISRQAVYKSRLIALTSLRQSISYPV